LENRIESTEVVEEYEEKLEDSKAIILTSLQEKIFKVTKSIVIACFVESDITTT
jgi:replicative DNA helicase